MSQGGYICVDKNLMEKKFKERQEKLKQMIDAGEAAEDTVVDPPSPPPRDDCWVEGQKTKKREFKVEATRIVAEKIELKGKSSQGSFVPHGRQDILVVALGKDDHLGRVRGVPGMMDIKKFYGSCASRRRVEQMIDKEELKEEVKQELIADLSFTDQLISRFLTNPAFTQMLMKQFSSMASQETAGVAQPSLVSIKESCKKTHVEVDKLSKRELELKLWELKLSQREFELS